MATNYTTGQLVQLTGTFTKVSDGSAQDPSTVVCKVRDPQGTVTTLSTSKTSTGVYTAQFLPTLPGVHAYEWIGSGAVQAAGVNQFFVGASTF